MSGVRSRPTYPGLRPVLEAHTHLVAVEGAGAGAVLEMVGGAPAGFARRTTVLLADSAGAAEEVGRLGELPLARFEVVDGPGQVLRLLDAALRTATMGTRVYAAGEEGFIGRVVRLGVDHGVDHRSVVTEHRGSLARRVQCVHCKLVTESVDVSIFECAACGTLLFVRDHYSRRLAAFQGVSVNAEDPTERPYPEVLYP